MSWLTANRNFNILVIPLSKKSCDSTRIEHRFKAGITSGVKSSYSCPSASHTTRIGSLAFRSRSFLSDQDTISPYGLCDAGFIDLPQQLLDAHRRKGDASDLGRVVIGRVGNAEAAAALRKVGATR